jgi:hypothetical protein
MKTLDEIAIECQTDRATQFTRTYGKPHGYAPHYARCFAPIRFDQLKVLEIGVGGGEGIRMWLEYFANARIYGVDNVRDTCEWNTPGKHDRYTSVYGDQASTIFWQCFKADYRSDFDVIIDDGGHCNDQIITTFDAMWPALKPGGFYAVEDLNVSYGGAPFVKDGWRNHMDWLKSKLDEINQRDEIAFAQFSKELVIIRKA